MLFKGPIERTFYYGKYLKSSIIFIQPCITKKIWRHQRDKMLDINYIIQVKSFF